MSFKIVVTYIKVKMCIHTHTHSYKGYLNSCTACRQHASWIAWRTGSWVAELTQGYTGLWRYSYPLH